MLRRVGADRWCFLADAGQELGRQLDAPTAWIAFRLDDRTASKRSRFPSRSSAILRDLNLRKNYES